MGFTTCFLEEDETGAQLHLPCLAGWGLAGLLVHLELDPNLHLQVVGGRPSSSPSSMSFPSSSTFLLSTGSSSKHFSCSKLLRFHHNNLLSFLKLKIKNNFIKPN